MLEKGYKCIILVASAILAGVVLTSCAPNVDAPSSSESSIETSTEEQTQTESESQTESSVETETSSETQTESSEKTETQTQTESESSSATQSQESSSIVESENESEVFSANTTQELLTEYKETFHDIFDQYFFTNVMKVAQRGHSVDKICDIDIKVADGETISQMQLTQLNSHMAMSFQNKMIGMNSSTQSLKHLATVKLLPATLKDFMLIWEDQQQQILVMQADLKLLKYHLTESRISMYTFTTHLTEIKA